MFNGGQTIQTRFELFSFGEKAQGFFITYNLQHMLWLSALIRHLALHKGIWSSKHKCHEGRHYALIRGYYSMLGPHKPTQRVIAL